MPAATFTPVDDVVSQATSAGFFPGRHAVDVTDVRRLSDGVFRLTFRDGYIAAHAKAAQFVNLFSHDSMMLMPRPFGVSEVRDDLVSVIFAVVGKGTQGSRVFMPGTGSTCSARSAARSTRNATHTICWSAEAWACRR